MPPSSPKPALASLAAFALVFDLAYLAVGSLGRDRFVGIVGTALGTWILLSAAALAAIAAHLVAAVGGYRRGKREFVDLDTRRLQIGAGIALVPMLGLHLTAWPVVAELQGIGALGAYARLRAALPLPASVAAHALGIAALGLHVHQGVVRLARMRGMGTARATALGGVAAFVASFTLLDCAAWFIVGRTFLPR